MAFFFVMNRRPPRSTRTDTLFPYTTLFRSRIVFTSPSLSGLWAAVGAGLGVTIRTPEGLPAPLAPLDADCGLPELGSTEVSLHRADRSEEHTSELQSLMRISYAVFCLKKTKLNKGKHILAHV